MIGWPWGSGHRSLWAVDPEGLIGVGGSLWVVVFGVLVGSISRTQNPSQGAAPTLSWCQLQVNNNGVISFDESVRQYTPDPFPLVDGHPLVAPYWADVDNVLGGDIFYRQTTDPALLGDISKHITQYFPKKPFTATWALVATWDHVAYYGSTSEKVRSIAHGA